MANIRKRSYVYRWGRFKGEFPTRGLAAKHIGKGCVYLMQCMKKKGITNDGWTVSDEPLDDEQMHYLSSFEREYNLKQDELEKKKNRKKDKPSSDGRGERRIRVLGKREFEIGKTNNIFNIPRKREDVKSNIMTLVYRYLDRNKSVNDLVYENIKELVESL